MFRIVFEKIFKKVQYLTFKYGKKMSIDERRNRQEFFAKLYAVIAFSSFCIVMGNYYVSDDKYLTTPVLSNHEPGDKFRHISYIGFKKVRDCDVELGPDNMLIVKRNHLEGTTLPESYRYGTKPE